MRASKPSPRRSPQPPLPAPLRNFDRSKGIGGLRFEPCQQRLSQRRREKGGKRRRWNLAATSRDLIGFEESPRAQIGKHCLQLRRRFSGEDIGRRGSEAIEQFQRQIKLAPRRVRWQCLHQAREAEPDPCRSGKASRNRIGTVENERAKLDQTRRGFRT